MSKLSERKEIRAAIARKALATTVETTVSNVDRILTNKTTTEPTRFQQDRVILTGNRFCGLCGEELQMDNQVQALYVYGINTLYSWANTCVDCTSKALCNVKRVDRKRILTTIANEIALNFLFELGESFSSSQEFLSTNWLDEFIGDEISRSLRLNDKRLLPWIACGKSNRKRIRKAAHKEVYQAIAQSLMNSREYTFADRKIQARINFLTSAIENEFVTGESLEVRKKRLFFYAERQIQRNMMFS